jgi:bifunctional non-homologous end joining protein LigD
VGTGYSDALLESLRSRLEGLRSDRCPFDEKPRVAGAHWVRPPLVAEVGFTEWTRSGKLRHPRFLGLRDDKRPRQVTRERARRAPT